MTPHELFLACQEWWLDSASGPELLYGVRMVSASLYGLAAALWTWNAVQPNELEATWTARDCRRFGIINWLMAAGVAAVATYYALAAVFEVDRTSSPHRLLLANCATSILALALIMLAVAWRAHYIRKRMSWRKDGKDVVVK